MDSWLLTTWFSGTIHSFKTILDAHLKSALKFFGKNQFENGMNRKNTVSIHNFFTFYDGPLSELLISKFLHFFFWFLLDTSCAVVCSGSYCDIKWWRKMKKVCTLHELPISKNIRHFLSQKAEIRCCEWPKFSTLGILNCFSILEVPILTCLMTSSFSLSRDHPRNCQGCDRTP